MEREELSVSMSPIWPQQHSKDLHKGNETRHGHPEEERNQVHHIPGRCSYDIVFQQGGAPGSPSRSIATAQPVGREKSILVPCQRIIYLGFVVNSETMTIATK